MRSWLNWKSGDQQSSSSSSQPSQQPPQHPSNNDNHTHRNNSQSRFDDAPPSPSRQRSLRQQMMSAGSSRNVAHPDDGQPPSQNPQREHRPPPPQAHFGGGGGVIQALMAGRTPGGAAAADAEMERRVAVAARNLGDGVSRIVLAARMGGGGGGGGGGPGRAPDPGEWKTRLLRLLGGADGEEEEGGSERPASDVDVLLANAGCERFVLRCVENELPPNLIHCLRLLRVLELQHDHAVATRFQRERERRRAEGGNPNDENKDDEDDDNRGADNNDDNNTDNNDDNNNNNDNNNDNDDSAAPPATQPVSTRAAKKVSRLLCLLCTDASVGEQLRPHLFGLLALSGASYPRSGVHIATAASDVILAFAASCLSASLVWFLHDRKMIVHMTDDVKELCSAAAPSAAAPSNSRCLYGPDAERAGLWVVALKTVVRLVAESCRHRCDELLRDYDAAGGYRILAHAIARSEGGRAAKLLELVTALACCRTDGDGAGSGRGDDGDADDGDGPAVDLAEAKVATNAQAFEIVDELMVRSVALIRAYADGNDGQRPGFGPRADFAAMARFSVDYAWDDLASPSTSALTSSYASNSPSSAPELPKADLVSELLVTTLQLYSDHAKNFDLIESEYHTLSHYILAFPSFSDVSVKVLTLKTLEYVCTGLAVANSAVPLKVATEVFAAMAERLLKEAGTMATPKEGGTEPQREGTDDANADNENDERRANAFRTMVQDAQLLCDTLVKLLEFDERVGYVMLDCGFLGAKVDDMLDLIMTTVMGVDVSTPSRDDNNDDDEEKEKEEVALDGELAQPSPTASTTMDEIYECVCRVLKNVVLNPEARAVHGERGNNSMRTEQIIAPDSSLNTFLTAGVLHLGDKASRAALEVFEGMMSKNHDELLRSDMACIIDLVDKFDPAIGGSPKSSADREPDASSSSAVPNADTKVDKLFIARQNAMLDMLTNILATNEPAQEVFRSCGGFECIVRIFFRLAGSINASKPNQQENDPDNGDSPEDDENKAVSSAIMELLESAFKLVATATRPVSRNQKNSSDLSTPPLAIDVLGEDDASITGTVISPTAAPSTANLMYLRNYGFYIEFANAMAEAGVLLDLMNARAVINMALEIIHPKLVLVDGKRSNSESKAQDNIIVHNADAVRLVLGIVIRLPESPSNVSLAKNAFDEILRLCANDMAGSSLTRLASSGLCSSLTNPNEFSHMLEDRSHFLYSRFVLLLRRIAAFSMTYNDFVSLLRCVAGPILLAEQEDGDEITNTSSLKRKRIRLAVISSSVQTKKSAVVTKSEAWQSRETGFCNRLETLSVIAERGDRVARCEVGGDSLNTIAMYMQKVPLEDRIYKLAEEGRLKFLEIESVDGSAKSLAATASATPQSSQAAASAAIWNPLVSTGFTYCAWLRQHHPIKDGSPCSLFVFDISTPPVENAPDGSFPYGSGGHDFFSFWYDIPNQRFCVLSSSNSRGEPTCFPMSPLPAGVWHHILLTYQAPKRSMLGRKAVLTLYIDGRPVEADAKVDTFNLPPTARIHIGVPNPVLASSGIIRGSLPVWDLGPTLLLSTVLGLRDATAMYTAGPDFPGLFWGDRPQRLSLAAAATAAFVMLAENGEKGSVAGALRRRKVPSMEAVGHVMRERGFGGGPAAGPESDSLSAVGLLCKLTPENVIFGFRAFSSSSSMRDDSSSNNRRHFSRRLINVSRISSNSPVSTDAVVYGCSSIIAPNCFADNVQWIGGPNILLPIVNASQSSSSLALSLRMIRESVRRHPPNLEMLQAGGGYRMLALLLRQKRIMDVNVLDQCFAFAVHGFVPGASDKESSKNKTAKNDPNSASALSKVATHRWVFADLDAMKYLLLNHQVWDLSGAGPELPLRLLTYFNGLVVAHSTHAAFNSRRLHLLGIIRWTLHLMLEATELYAAGASAATVGKKTDDPDEQFQRSVSTDAGTNKLGIAGTTALKNGWLAKPPAVSRVAAGGDPSNEMLLGCKTLLRRVLTFMLTPGDLEAIAGAAIYTVSITGGSAQEPNPEDYQDGQPPYGSDASREKLAPGAVARVYLLRLLEELVVDGVNEIVADDNKGGADGEGPRDAAVEPHSGGGYSAGRGKGDAIQHPKHQEAQIFLSAFAGILTPVWFACILEGCREEASASAVLRLMILMIQNSRKFAVAFEEAGGFAPLVLSIPKFSTCPSIILSMLSHLLHAPILHLPCFASLDPKQLCEVFDQESDSPDLINNDYQDSLRGPSDPSCGIFALLAECLGRNIQLAGFDSEMGRKARNTNEAVLQLLSHRHAFSIAFQDFCRTPDFLEPLAQALCLVHDEKLQKMQRSAFGGPPLPKQDDEEFNNNSYEGGVENEYADQYNENMDSHPSSDHATWASNQQQDKPIRTSRRGSLCDIRTDETPTERFVGKIEEEGEGSGIGMVQLLHLVLSHAVLKGPLAAPLVSALFRSFPIHASPDQVEAFHLVLIEHCRSVVEDALQRGEPIALANCIGVSSVLLDRLMAGFFTSEPVLEAVNIVMLTLNCLTSSGTYASRTLANVDQNLLVADTAHIARLTCLTALHRSRPMGAYDEGDDELKLAVLTKIGQSMRQLLLVPSNLLGPQASRRQGYPTPAQNTRFFPLWQSASLSRCCPPSVSCTYPDLTMIDEPDRAFVVTLMADIHSMLLDSRRDIREQAVVVVVSLLQRRRGIMSELLITDIPRGDRIDTVDLMNRGGFGALLVAHEATTIAENIGPGKSMSQERSNSIPGKMKYGSFFEWLERNQDQVAAVFHGIHIQASRLDITTHVGAATPEEAIENEQKVMLLKLTSQDSSDRTILGGLERAELAQISHEATAESHTLWKRQGFDDLSSGAMQWKFLLRQLKGSCTIWEGGVNFDENSLFAKSRLVSKLLARRDDSEESDDKSNAITTENTVKRWKLDLTEGYERQRRRLLPNYEFHGLYNIDEKSDNVGYVDIVSADGVENAEDSATDNVTESETTTLADSSASANPTQNSESGEAYGPSVQDVLPAEMEITADLLKKMKLEKRNDEYEDEFENMDMDDEENDDYGIGLGDDVSVMGTFTVGGDDSVHPSMLSDRKNQASNDPDTKRKDEDENEHAEDENDKSNISASSYDLITGLLKAGDWPEKSYNVNRCTGLEVRKALLLWCRNALYVVDGFEQTDGEGLKGKINRLKKATTSYQVNIRGTSGTGGITREKNKGKEKSSNENSDEEITYQHRSQRIAFSDLYSVYRRRYQLQQNALEFYDVHRNGTLLAFSTHTEREEVLSKVLSSPLPSSIFSSSILGGSTSINYKKFMNNLRAKITSQWVQGKMTNFDFIMHMNSFAGRTYNDLTQYPVFPWVLADYESEELDLNDPSIYRDLSKPMGAQNENRAVQFRDRFEALEQSYEMGDGPPPFHYGTHYSCAAYVLYYLMRLEPFSRLALSLQGGKFDVADRLFHNVGASWRSASSENLQDVRELIPEFFYLPDFLVNSNMFDFGTTQLGKTVHDLTLPPWAKGDPKRFIRIHRQALESDHVSRHLHQWLDLIFGYKQRGREAVASLNTFVHVTYEGQVDLESITDPVERDSIIAQIQNFGQTPSRLERKPFPQRNVFVAFKEKGVDFNALASLASMTPPFCVVGAPHRVYVRVGAIDTCKVGMAGQVDSSVGDLFLVKGQLIGVGRTCSLILPSKKYYRFGGPNNGVSVHVAVASARHREVNKVLSIHDGMHRGPISVARASLNGLWLLTGCVDSTVRVWKYNGQNMQLQATLCGHDGGKITCLDISTVFGTIVSGGTDGKILVWDLRTLTFLRQLHHLPSPSSASREGPRKALPAKSVSINHKNGNIVTLVHNTLCVFDINGNLVAKHDPEINFDGSDIPSCAISTDCPEWMENGVVAVTGHINGDVRLWSIDYDYGIIILRHTIPERVHSCPITALRVSGDKQDTLLIGDKSGKMSVCNTLKLEQLNANELAAVVEEALEGEVY